LIAVHFGDTRFLWSYCSLEIFFAVGHDGHGLPLNLSGLAIESCGDRDRFFEFFDFSATQIGQILEAVDLGVQEVVGFGGYDAS